MNRNQNRKRFSGFKSIPAQLRWAARFLAHCPIKTFGSMVMVCTLLACGSSGEAPPVNSAETSTEPETETGTGAETENSVQNRVEYRGNAIYLNGVNVAWLDFARDFNSGNGIRETELRAMLDAVTRAGGNSLRWWLHVDGSSSPVWQSVNNQQLVVGPGEELVADFQRALDVAAEYQVYIIPSLWSFDMLKCNDYRRPPNHDNYRLLSDDTVLQSYIDNALVPMVTALNNHPQLLAWELFNEPENMTESWMPGQAADCSETPYTGAMPTLEQLQRVQAKMAAAIHATAAALQQEALVTTGSKSMGKYNSDVAGGYNWYRDDRMIAAADGDVLATLDFYAPHYYNNENKAGAWSPFHHPASYWEVDKAVVIGEYHTHRLDVLNDPVEAAQLCQRLVELGYAGGWPWQWADGAEVQQEIRSCIGQVQL